MTDNKNDNKNEAQNSGTAAANAEVYGNGPGDIKTPSGQGVHNFFKDKFYSTSLLGVLDAKTGRFDYNMIDDPIKVQINEIFTKSVEKEKYHSKQGVLYAEHKELENTVDKAIYELLDISWGRRKTEDQEQWEASTDEFKGPLSSLAAVEDIVPNEKELNNKKQQFYNMKYYIFSNILNEKAFLESGDCKKFQNNLTNRLEELKNVPEGKAFNRLKETSDVTKLTYILSATMGDKHINNTNYIKDRLAEQTLKKELGPFVNNTLDDYKHWLEADIDSGKSNTPAIRGLLAFLISIVVGNMVWMIGIGTGAIVLPIVLYGVIASVGAGVGWAIYYFGSQRDQYTPIYEDMQTRMKGINNNNIDDTLPTKDALDLLGTVEILMAEKKPEHEQTLNNYRDMLSQHSGVKELKKSNLNDIFSKQIGAINENLNKNWDGLYRTRTTAKQKKEISPEAGDLNTSLLNEDLNQNVQIPENGVKGLINFNEDLKSNENDQELTKKENQILKEKVARLENELKKKNIKENDDKENDDFFSFLDDTIKKNSIKNAVDNNNNREQKVTRMQ